MSEKETQSTTIAADLVDMFDDSPRGKEDMKRAILGALTMCLVLLWAPMPSFSKPIDVHQPPPKPLPTNTIIKPLAEKPLEQVQVRDKLAKKAPVPDLTPQKPELVIEPEEMEQPDIIYSDDDFADFSEIPAAPELPEGGIFTPASLELEVPVITKRVPPNYPKRGISLNMQGYVIVSAVMRADGSIDEVKVLRGLGRGKIGFEEEAIKAVKQWEFLPGKHRNKPVDVRLTLKIDFQMR